MNIQQLDKLKMIFSYKTKVKFIKNNFQEDFFFNCFTFAGKGAVFKVFEKFGYIAIIMQKLVIFICNLIYHILH